MRRRNRRGVVLRLLTAVILLIGVAPAAAGHVIHVKPNAPAGGNGRTWDSAYRNLQRALDVAARRAGAVEIRVARGTYGPSRRVDASEPRSRSFTLPQGVELYGGFKGDEVLREQRDPQRHRTVLSGGGAWHVVRAIGAGGGTILDGFTIQGGNADEFEWPNDVGGGVLVVGGSPVFRNCTISGNHALREGGGIFVRAGHPRFEQCTFASNRARSGAGLKIVGGRAVFENCVFTGNRAADDGGAVSAVRAAVTVHGGRLAGNRAETGGAIAMRFGRLDLVGGALSGNIAERHGGAIWYWGSEALVTGVTIASNAAGQRGGALFVRAGDIRLCNAILWGNAADCGPGVELESRNAFLCVERTDLEGGPDAIGTSPGVTEPMVEWGPGNLDADPMFVDPAGPDGQVGTRDDDFRLRAGSPCIDAGDNRNLPPGLGSDVAKAPRYVDDPATPDVVTPRDTGAVADLGGFEYQTTAPSCPSDLDGSGRVDLDDLTRLLHGWGRCPDRHGCPADLGGDGVVGYRDLLELLGAWGSC